MTLPETLSSGAYVPMAVKKYKAFSQLVKAKIDEQFSDLKNDPYAQYFIEIQAKLLAKGLHNVRQNADK